MCKCVQYYCHRVTTQLQLTDISYPIMTLSQLIYKRLSLPATFAIFDTGQRSDAHFSEFAEALDASCNRFIIENWSNLLTPSLRKFSTNIASERRPQPEGRRYLHTQILRTSASFIERSFNAHNMARRFPKDRKLRLRNCWTDATLEVIRAVWMTI